MNIQQIFHWVTFVITVDAVIKQVAVKYGYTKLVTICDFIADHLNFVVDVFIGLLSAFKKPIVKPPEVKP